MPYIANTSSNVYPPGTLTSRFFHIALINATITLIPAAITPNNSIIVVVTAAAFTSEKEKKNGFELKIQPIGVEVGGPSGLEEVCHLRAAMVSLTISLGPK